MVAYLVVHLLNMMANLDLNSANDKLLWLDAEVGVGRGDLLDQVFRISVKIINISISSSLLQLVLPIFIIISNTHMVDLSYLIITIIILVIIQMRRYQRRKGTIGIFDTIKRIIKKDHPQQIFRWSISKFQHTSFKNGYGILNLQHQNPQQFLLLSIMPQGQFDTVRIISNWRLSNLTRLFLNGNKIESIQMLSYLEMPYLQCLAISNNNITNLKSLRKLIAPGLIWIQINNNYLIQYLSPLTQLNAPYLQFLWLQFFENDHKSNDNSQWVAKCSSINLQKFHIKSQQRIKQTNLYEIIKRKYSKIDIRVKF